LKNIKSQKKIKLANPNEYSINKFEIQNDELFNNNIINDPYSNKKIIKKFQISKSKEISTILLNIHDNKNHVGITAIKQLYIQIMVIR